MDFVIILVLFLLGLFFLLWRQKESVEVSMVRSNVDGRDYVVQNKADKQQAADMLAKVRQRMIKLVEYVKQTCATTSQTHTKEEKEDQNKFGTYKERMERLVMRFNPDRMSEGNEDVRYTTYTLNKGEKIVFCLRARGEDDRVHDLEMMTFVAIHELAHIASVTEHHTPEFNANFAWLLKKAMDCGVYQFEDFNTRPRKYCGINVTDTPVSG